MHAARPGHCIGARVRSAHAEHGRGTPCLHRVGCGGMKRRSEKILALAQMISHLLHLVVAVGVKEGHFAKQSRGETPPCVLLWLWFGDWGGGGRGYARAG